MHRGQVHHISKRRYKKLQEQCKKVVKHCTIENIHQFRVEYKKMRSFLRMISHNKKAGKEIKIPEKIKKAYRVSGAIRDLQLQRGRITNAVKGVHEKPRAYLTLLQKKINDLKPALCEILLTKSITENRKKTDAADLRKLSLTDFKLFAQKKWEIIYSIIATGHFIDDNLHSIRKHLKDLFYNLKLYKGIEYEKLLSSAVRGKDEPYFHQLISELGNFQDNCTALTLLQLYPQKDPNKYNRQITGYLKKIWQKEKAGRKRLLVQQLTSDIA